MFQREAKPAKFRSSGVAASAAVVASIADAADANIFLVTL
jgi:hypothetical protein